MQELKFSNVNKISFHFPRQGVNPTIVQDILYPIPPRKARQYVMLCIFYLKSTHKNNAGVSIAKEFPSTKTTLTSLQSLKGKCEHL